MTENTKLYKRSRELIRHLDGIMSANRPTLKSIFGARTWNNAFLALCHLDTLPNPVILIDLCYALDVHNFDLVKGSLKILIDQDLASPYQIFLPSFIDGAHRAKEHTAYVITKKGRDLLSKIVTGGIIKKKAPRNKSAIASGWNITVYEPHAKQA